MVRLPIDGGARELTALSVLMAFRRRWIPALGIGLPAAILAAALVWKLIPAKYESYALLKIQQFEQVLTFETKERHTEFLTYRDTQKAFLTSRGVLTAALRNPEVAQCETLKLVDHPVDWLTRELIVDEQISPEFLRIGLSGRDPADLALIVNAVKDAYLNEVVYNERNDRLNRLRKLEHSFREVDAQVRGAQENIDRLAENLGSGDSRVAILNQGLIQQQLMDLQKDLREINARIRAEETARQSLQESGHSPSQLNTDSLMGINGSGLPAGSTISEPAYGTSAAGSGVLQRELLILRQNIAQFKRQVRDRSHPDLLDMQRQEQRLLAMLQGMPVGSDGDGLESSAGKSSSTTFSRMDWLIRQRDRLQQEIADQTRLFNEIGARIVEMEREKREIEQDTKIRDELYSELNERRVELNAPERITVVQEAHIPEKPEVRKKTQLTILSGLAMLGFIAGGFTLFEWFLYRVGSASDLTNEAGLRLLGSIPSPEQGGLPGLGIFTRRVDEEEWKRAVTESMDVVRTYLTRYIAPTRPASILITSASAHEGKSTISCQLAASLTRTGRRLALVDCDFRRPTLHQMVDGLPAPGLSEYLRGECDFSQICQQTSASGLTFLSAGHVNQDVLRVLAADGGRGLMRQLKAAFDVVIIDTSPLLFVAEPSMIAQHADIVLLAARREYSRIPYIIQARDTLRNLQVPLLGAVMIGADSDFQRQAYGYQQDVVRFSRMVEARSDSAEQRKSTEPDSGILETCSPNSDLQQQSATINSGRGQYDSGFFRV